MKPRAEAGVAVGFGTPLVLAVGNTAMEGGFANKTLLVVGFWETRLFWKL